MTESGKSTRRKFLQGAGGAALTIAAPAPVLTKAFGGEIVQKAAGIIIEHVTPYDLQFLLEYFGVTPKGETDLECFCEGLDAFQVTLLNPDYKYDEYDFDLDDLMDFFNPEFQGAPEHIRLEQIVAEENFDVLVKAAKLEEERYDWGSDIEEKARATQATWRNLLNVVYDQGLAQPTDSLDDLYRKVALPTMQSHAKKLAVTLLNRPSKVSAGFEMSRLSNQQKAWLKQELPDRADEIDRAIDVYKKYKAKQDLERQNRDFAEDNLSIRFLGQKNYEAQYEFIFQKTGGRSDGAIMDWLGSGLPFFDETTTVERQGHPTDRTFHVTTSARAVQLILNARAENVHALGESGTFEIEP